MGWLLRGIGDAGAQVGEGYLTAQDYKQKRLQMLMEQAKQKQQEMMLPLQLEEMQEQIKQWQFQREQAQQPKPYGIETGPTGEKYGITYGPKGFIKDLIIAGRPMGEWQAGIQRLISVIPEDKQPLAKQLAAYYGQYGEYDKAADAIRNLATRAEPRPFSPEEQYITAKQKELGRELNSKELKEAHEKFQPYGAQRIQILLAGLDERKKQDLLTDVDRLEKRIQPYEHLLRITSELPGYVQNPSGPGDLSLLNAFVEATKPERGFRWTQQEVTMITGARGWVQGAAARIQQGYEGVLFGPQGSDQRRIMSEIVAKAASQSKKQRDTIKNEYINARPELKDFIEEETPPETTPGMGTGTPPPGAKVRDYTQVGP